jgi:hypothetical protein
MNLNIEPLNIPTAILNLPDATPSEKLLLALYLTNPEASNRMAIKAVGVGASGLKKIRKRLIAKNWLRPTAHGYRLTIPGLEATPEAEAGHFFPKSKATEKENKVAPARKVESLEEIIRSYCEDYVWLTKEPGKYDHLFVVELTRKTLDQLESDVPDGPLKERAVEALTNQDNKYYAWDYALNNWSRKDQQKAGRQIIDATPEQLAALRTAIDQAQLPGGKRVALLEGFPGKG